ncbi:TetR/AcrR family transcriptional regulator [Colwellia sp. 20A7]|uniref:TetR/AcrR family transcriptional regulator n=1 Tax=Colwellia sp. 20A7 TaxID=2689569 RepID=UPI001358A825|nr:TetR/AcrR family transcriptional regulator [Colwellia sp. 20A7]
MQITEKSAAKIKQGRSRGRPKGEDTSVPTDESYLRTALDTFAELGFEGVSVRDLSKYMGVSHTLIHSKFGTKEELWKLAIAHGFGDMEAQIIGTLDGQLIENDPVEGLRKLLVELLLSIARIPSILKIMNYEGARGGLRFDYITEHFLNHSFPPIEAIFERCVNERRLKKIDPSFLFILVAHGGGAMLALEPLAEALKLPVPKTIDSIHTRALEIADFAINGLRIID